MVAAQLGHGAVAQILLDHGADPDISIGLRGETVTALGIAEASGNKHLEYILN